MNLPIYHETSAAIYFDNGDGSLTVKQKKNTKIKQTLAVFKNDSQGRDAYRQFRKTLVDNGNRVYTLYRCPIDNSTYDQTARKSSTFFHSRRGSIQKNLAKVMVVLRTNSPR
jgi:hypothetical protein